MRSVKKASLYFGLINTPVKLYVATEDHDVHFHQHHATCTDKPSQGAIKMPRECEDCGAKVDYADIVSGIDVNGKLVVVDKQDKDQLIDEQDPGIEVVEFVNRDEVDPILFEKTHLLDADKGGEKLYALLRNALANSTKVGVVRFTLSQKTHMGVLRVLRHKDGDVLAIHTLRWVDEVRSTGELLGAKKKINLVPDEVAMMQQAIESRVETWNPEQYTDTYTERLNEFVATRAAGDEFVPKTREDEGEAEVSDLLAMLKASVVVKEAA